MHQPKTDWLNGYKNKTHKYAVKRDPLHTQGHLRLKVREWKNVFHTNENDKKVGVAIFILVK